MHGEIQVFTNEKFGSIRTTVINGKPWFVGRDVAEALGYESPRSAVSKKVDAKDRGVAEDGMHQHPQHGKGIEHPRKKVRPVPALPPLPVPRPVRETDALPVLPCWEKNCNLHMRVLS